MRKGGKRAREKENDKRNKDKRVRKKGGKEELKKRERE